MSDSSNAFKKRGRPPRDTSVNSNKAKKIAHLEELRASNTRILRNSSKKTQTAVKKPVDVTQKPDISTQAASSSTAISNRFDVLPEVNTSVTQNTQVIKNPENKKKAYVPPIVIQGMQLSKLNEILNSHKINDYKIKLISVGIKLTLKDLSEYSTITAVLKKLESEFFSYSNSDTNPLKIVLTGLPKFESDDIKDELVSAGVDKDFILEVVPLKPNGKSYNIHENTNYLIKFDKSKVKLHDIKKIKYLFNVVIRWFPHVSSRKGPTQCRNCQMYGHGTSHCNRKVRCKKCGDNHSGEDCINDLPKCVNCGGDHEADFSDCFGRKSYVAIRENISIGRQINSYKDSSRSIPVRERSYNRFSSSQPLSTNRKNSFEFNRNVNFNDRSAAGFPDLSLGRSNIDRNSFFKKFSSSQPISSSFMVRNQDSSSNEDLFSIDELTSLVSELTTKISVCRTRAQQFEVIMRLSLQYLGKTQCP